MFAGEGCFQVADDSRWGCRCRRSASVADKSQTNLAPLEDKAVIVSHPQRGLGIATLRDYAGTQVLESQNPEYVSFSLQLAIGAGACWGECCVG